MTITTTHTDRAHQLGQKRAKERLQHTPALPEENMVELWDDVSDYDLYQTVTGHKFPVYSTDHDMWEREKLAESFMDGYYDEYDAANPAETYGYRD